MKGKYLMNMGPRGEQIIHRSVLESEKKTSGIRERRKSAGFWASKNLSLTGPSAEIEKNEKEMFDEKLSFWKRQLTGTLPALELSLDRSRSRTRNFKYAEYQFGIPEKTKCAFDKFCDGQKTIRSPFMLGCFEALLFRYTGQEDLIVGHLRPNPSCHVHILRSAMSSKMTFEELVEHVTARQVEANIHDVSLVKITNALGIDHDSLCQVLFSFDQQDDGSSLNPSTSHFDLLLRINESAERLDCAFKYNSELFDNETISRMADHFVNLVDGAIERPSQAISALPILSENERRHILVEWNKTQAHYPNACVHNLFEQQAANTPDRVAVIFEGVALSYRQLEQRANQLAHYLRGVGVGAETLVGLCVHRSAEMVIAMLAILKAGGAYVPLDPAFPADRLTFMVEDSRMPVLLTETDLQTLIPAKGVRKICLDQATGAVTKNISTPPASTARPENLAYILYTSGSTGKPKGVQIIHSAVVNFLISMQRDPGLTAKDRLLAITTLSFDIAGLEIFLPLITGAQVVVAPREIATDGIRLAEKIYKSKITVMQATPATWRLLLQSGWKGSSRLKVLCGGEALTPDLSDAMLSRCGELWNLYGPTETTIWSSAIRVRAGERIVVGPPIANTTFYILDEQLQPVPVGVAGELCIGGDGLARGYLNRPELTAEKFIADPFSTKVGAKIYKTGDLAKFRWDGNIEFLGRKDNQVKIRGFRIELGEIETALSRCDSIQQNVVVAREDAPGEKRLVAYFVSKGGQVPAGDLRKFLSERLPEYMIPSAFVQLNAFPLTPNGKVDRRALPAPDSERPEVTATYICPRNEAEKAIARIWQDVLNLEKVGVYDNFFELGGYSLLLVKVHSKLCKAFAKQIPMVEMFRYPTVESLAQYFLETAQPEPAVPQKIREEHFEHHVKPSTHENSIAIVGIAGRFPGAKNVEEFWSNLRDGVESIFRLSDEELLARGVSSEELKNPKYVKAGTDLQAFDQFDAGFFGFNPREAEIIDPQQRLFLETAWEALENAGCVPENYPGRIGVFAGTGMNTYIFNWVQHYLDGSIDSYQAMLGNDKDFLTTRLSYKLSLRGPSVTIQTACSTSLVAVHVACQNLLLGECEVALAGGVALGTTPRIGYLHQEGMILSPDGHCRVFDEKSAGTIGGIGVGIVVLKRLCDALKDGDTIHAIIRGTAINNDGGEKVGYTAPSSAGQAQVVMMAQAAANVDPQTITYVEAHGTGTPLGDPIEIAGLTEAFRVRTDKKQFCAIGSVKANVGHLDAAAGVAGLIKTTLALKYKQLPPSLHFNKPNPKIDFENSPFYVNTQLQDWRLHNGTPRRAAVSAFGIGGTNAHAVLEEAPPLQSSEKTRSYQLLLLSAKTPNALLSAATNLVAYFKERPEIKFSDAAYTLQTGRKHFNRRAFCVCENSVEASAMLEGSQGIISAIEEPRDRKIVFLLSGQGSQHPNMGAELYQNEKVFREALDQCAEIAKPKIQIDLRNLLFHPENSTAAQKLNQTVFAQPALFTIDYALAKLWMSWGIIPEAMLGHSIGEYVAACLAGVFSLEDGLSLVAERGRMMQQLPGGSMLAVPFSEGQIQSCLNNEIALAASNGPSLNVVAGQSEAIEQLQTKLVAQGVDCKRLHTSHAFHSPMTEPILQTFTARVKNVRLNPPTLPYISNVTGTWIKSEEATDPIYWAKHLRNTVRFSEGIRELSKDLDRVFLEVGPGQTLTALTKLHGDGKSAPKVFPSLCHVAEEKSDQKQVLTTLGNLWALGAKVNWAGFYGNERRLHLPLPTYPFERQRYWIDAPQYIPAVKADGADRAGFEKWFYLPSWKRSVIDHISARQAASERATWLIFCDECGLGESLAQQLRQLGQIVTTVSIGQGFSKSADNSFVFNPRASGDYKTLFEALSTAGRTPTRIVHFWSVTSPKAKRRLSADSLEFALELNFYSLLHIAQVIREKMSDAQVQLKVVSNQLQQVTGDEQLSAEKAAILGPCRVIPQENKNVQCACIDVVLPELKKADRFNELLLDELFAKVVEPVVAHRGEHRWVQTFESVNLDKIPETKPVIRDGGVYFVTGGLGGIGFVLSEHLARTAKAKLVLTCRTKIPPRNEWGKWLEEHGETDGISRAIQKIESLERLGAQVLCVGADVADWQKMKGAVAEAEAKFGKINGVIHAAGVAGGGVIDLKTREAAHRVLSPKIHGTLALQHALENRALDFFAVCSSVNAIIGGVGQVDYCAANAFLDAFAQQHRSRNVVSINWSVWKEVGMAVNTELPELLRAEREKGLRLGICSREGVDAFTRIIANRLPQVVVSPENFKQLAEQSVIPIETAENHYESMPKHSRPSVANDYVGPKTDLEKALVEIWQQVLGIEKVGVQDDFFQLGGHSLLAITLFTKIKKLTDRDLPLSFLFEAPTVQKMAAFLNDGKNAVEIKNSRSQVIVPIKSTGAKLPFFCIHGVGGAVVEYSHLARYMDPDQPLYGIQAQGLDGKEPRLKTIEEMAERYLEEIKAIQPEGPYRLGGSSFGGIVAFEIAQRLQANHESVGLLALFDSYGKNYPTLLPTTTRFRAKLHRACARFDLHFTNLRLLEAKNWPAYIHDKAVRIPLRWGRRIKKFKQRVRFLFLPRTLRNQFEWTGDDGGDLWYFKLPKAYSAVAELNLQSTLGYHYKPFSGKAVLFRASKQPQGIHPDETNGWGSLIQGDLQIIEVPGYHGAIIREPLVRNLAPKLNELLSKESSL